MARCSTCHRRLKTGQACSVHGGVLAVVAPATVFERPMDLVAGERVGELLGSGGFASVWAIGADRVIKIAHAGHELSRARLAREAEALRAIGAPAVPHCHASGVLDDGRAWIVMDRVIGVTIADVTADGPLRSGETVGIGIAILDALERVHAARFVHRDLKPDNLVRAPDGSVVILDLGLARKLPDDPNDPTRAGVQVGSLEYIPPEQIVDSANVDERSDIYAFGCVLYELLSGRPPFLGDAAVLERAHTALRPPRLGALASIPAAIESLCHDCLAKEPGRRPATAAAVRDRLAVARDERTPPRASHSVSVIREGKQPVVLLWAELPKVDRALIGMLTGRRLVVASQRGRRVLAGVLGGEHADPAAIGIAAARDLAAAGARVALHLEALRVSSTAGAMTLHGEPVDKPETWLPKATWTGVVVTLALASVSQAQTRTVESLGLEFRALADDRQRIELFGREALLGDLMADAATALHGVANDRASRPTERPRRGSSKSSTWQAMGPGFALLVGDAGVGKTAFATELAQRLGELGAHVHFGTVPAPGMGKPGSSALTGLIGTPQGPIVRAIGDALRAAASARPTAVILDDLHLAEHELLDALEYATLGGESVPLWVLGVAARRLDTRRPDLGSRAERRRRDVLPPLDEDAAVALAAALLRPAEYPPLRALRRIVGISHGNPLHLTMLTREIHQRGAIRQRSGGAHFFDTSALDELSPAALGPWLAARELAELSVELVALARVCAVLGGEVHRDELVAIVEAVERAGGATTTIDVDIGLRELVGAGLLDETSGGFVFRQSLVEEGIYTTTNEDERLALHRAALEHERRVSLEDPAVAERVARHAEAVGDRPTAAAAFAAIGKHALAQQRSLDADQAWSGAIRNLDADNAERGRALLGRATARYRQQRVVDSLADLEAALLCAETAGDAALEVDVLIERSTVLDWREDFVASAAIAARARERLAAAPSIEREINLELAEGRADFRAGRFPETVVKLGAVMERALAEGYVESAIIAGLLLGPTMASLRDSRAEAVFAKIISLCEERGDRLHLGTAYANRHWLWVSRGEIDRTADDLQRVIQLAREIGQISLERIGTYNLVEGLLWEGKLDEAVPLIRRCLVIQHSHGEGSTLPDRMMLGRVLAARGDHEELAEIVAGFANDKLEGSDIALAAALRAVLDPSLWEEALTASDELEPALRLEVAHLATRNQRPLGGRQAAVLALAREHVLWRHRIGELDGRPTSPT